MAFELQQQQQQQQQCLQNPAQARFNQQKPHTLQMPG
jgi:hypothetical protein